MSYVLVLIQMNIVTVLSTTEIDEAAMGSFLGHKISGDTATLVVTLVCKIFLVNSSIPWFAEIVGGADTPYEGGVFSLEIKVPER